MRQTLNLIKKKQQRFAQLSLFEFMQDKTIDPVKRLAFAPCAAPFIMSFTDLCKYVLREEPTSDKVQEILNFHTYEDDFHWQWYLADLEKLGFNYSLEFNDSLTFLWGDETKASRFLAHELYRLIVESNAVEKLMILEAMEAAADVFLAQTGKITKELEPITNLEYEYFGSSHSAAEHNHNTRSHDARKFIQNIRVSPEAEQKIADLVEQVFQLFTHWSDRLLSFAQDYQISQPATSTKKQKVLILS